MKRDAAFAILAFAVIAGVLLFGSCASEKSASQSAAPPAPKAAKILMFYAAQVSFNPGERAQVCYGVENATSVRLDPPVEEIRPLSNKCVWFQPKGSMDLTLIAMGEDGNEVKQTIPITVKAGSPSSTQVAPSGPEQTALIQTFVATSGTVSPGGASTLCYVLSEPATLSLSPESGDLGSDLRKCVLVRPKTTTTYTLTAKANGKSDKATVTVKVQ